MNQNPFDLKVEVKPFSRLEAVQFLLYLGRAKKAFRNFFEYDDKLKFLNQETLIETDLYCKKVYPDTAWKTF